MMISLDMSTPSPPINTLPCINTRSPSASSNGSIDILAQMVFQEFSGSVDERRNHSQSNVSLAETSDTALISSSTGAVLNNSSSSSSDSDCSANNNTVSSSGNNNNINNSPSQYSPYKSQCTDSRIQDLIESPIINKGLSPRLSKIMKQRQELTGAHFESCSFDSEMFLDSPEKSRSLNSDNTNANNTNGANNCGSDDDCGDKLDIHENLILENSPPSSSSMVIKPPTKPSPARLSNNPITNYFVSSSPRALAIFKAAAKTKSKPSSVVTASQTESDISACKSVSTSPVPAVSNQLKRSASYQETYNLRSSSISSPKRPATFSYSLSRGSAFLNAAKISKLSKPPLDITTSKNESPEEIIVQEEAKINDDSVNSTPKKAGILRKTPSSYSSTKKQGKNKKVCFCDPIVSSELFFDSSKCFLPKPIKIAPSPPQTEPKCVDLDLEVTSDSLLDREESSDISYKKQKLNDSTSKVIIKRVESLEDNTLNDLNAENNENGIAIKNEEDAQIEVEYTLRSRKVSKNYLNLFTNDLADDKANENSGDLVESDVINEKNKVEMENVISGNQEKCIENMDVNNETEPEAKCNKDLIEDNEKETSKVNNDEKIKENVSNSPTKSAIDNCIPSFIPDNSVIEIVDYSEYVTSSQNQSVISDSENNSSVVMEMDTDISPILPVLGSETEIVNGDCSQEVVKSSDKNNVDSFIDESNDMDIVQETSSSETVSEVEPAISQKTTDPKQTNTSIVAGGPIISARALSILKAASNKSGKQTKVFVEKLSSSSAPEYKEAQSETSLKYNIATRAAASSRLMSPLHHRGSTFLQAAQANQAKRFQSSQEMCRSDITIEMVCDTGSLNQVTPKKSILRTPDKLVKNETPLSKKKVIFTEPLVSSEVRFDSSKSNLVICDYFGTAKIPNKTLGTDTNESNEKSEDNILPVDIIESQLLNVSAKSQTSMETYSQDLTCDQDENLVYMKRRKQLCHQNSTYVDCDNIVIQQCSSITDEDSLPISDKIVLSEPTTSSTTADKNDTFESGLIDDSAATVTEDESAVYVSMSYKTFKLDIDLDSCASTSHSNENPINDEKTNENTSSDENNKISSSTDEQVETSVVEGSFTATHVEPSDMSLVSSGNYTVHPTSTETNMSGGGSSSNESEETFQSIYTQRFIKQNESEEKVPSPTPQTSNTTGSSTPVLESDQAESASTNSEQSVENKTPALITEPPNVAILNNEKCLHTPETLDKKEDCVNSETVVQNTVSNKNEAKDDNEEIVHVPMPLKLVKQFYHYLGKFLTENKHIDY